MGEKWNGGDVKLTTGGGQKVNILVKELEKYKDDKNKVILFTDRYIYLLKIFIFIPKKKKKKILFLFILNRF